MPNPIPARKGGPSRTIHTAKNRKAFLAALEEGHSVAAACDAAKISRTGAYQWRHADPDFAEAWDAAVDAGTDRLEDAAMHRARRGTKRPVFYNGVQCGDITEYSDTLTIFLLKARRPEKYWREQMPQGKTDGGDGINVTGGLPAAGPKDDGEPTGDE